jgi:hypothetical protein
MGFKVKTKISLPVLQDIKELNSSRNLDKVGNLVVNEMKDSISRGLSPVRGEGRFEAYSGQKIERGGRSKGYPFNVQKKFPNKKVRPVNLFLSGDMLEALTHKKKSDSILVGIFKPSEAEKAQGHQLGDPKKGLPRRRFIPAANGEEFTVSITRSIRQLYSELLDGILKKRK